MRNRFDNAYEIWHNGASNPRGVARSLVEAIDEAVEEGRGSAAAADPAVQMILDQLCWLCGLPQPCMVNGGYIWMDVKEGVEKGRTK